MKTLQIARRLETAKKKNPRSEFLSNLMKAVSGAPGEKVINAFFGSSAGAFSSAMQELTQGLVKNMPNVKEEK